MLLRGYVLPLTAVFAVGTYNCGEILNSPAPLENCPPLINVSRFKGLGVGRKNASCPSRFVPTVTFLCDALLRTTMAVPGTGRAEIGCASGSILMWAMLDKYSVSEDTVGGFVLLWLKAPSGMGRQATSPSRNSSNIV